nr:hypothetical protein [Murinocardiopsis flavida]
MPEVVQPDRTHLGLLNEALEGSGEVAELQRPAGPVREDETHLMPAVPRAAFAIRLPTGLLDQRVARPWEQRQGPPARTGLDVDQGERAVTPLDLSPNRQIVVRHVDVVPGKPEDFAAA